MNLLDVVHFIYFFHIFWGGEKGGGDCETKNYQLLYVWLWKERILVQWLLRDTRPFKGLMGHEHCILPIIMFYFC